MKQLITFCLLIGFIQLNAQYKFNSTYYIENSTEYQDLNSFNVNLGKIYSVSHSSLNIDNYPLKLKDVKDDVEPFIVNLEPNITPENYDNDIFKTYGYRGYQIYFKDGKIIAIVEIIKSYNTSNIKIIKYLN